MSKIVIAKYHNNNETFEIFVDADIAYDFITGKINDPLKALDVEEIFKDAKKGERQSAEKQNKIFKTTDISKIVEIILKNGEVPITTEQKNKLLEEKRKQIIEIISKNSIDPRTNAPNPPIRVENAMQQAKVTINPFKSANEQIEEIVKKINIIMPIKFTNAKLVITIPPEFSNRCYGILKQFGLKSEQWLSNGSLQANLEFPAGLQTDFFDKINKATQGKAEIKILE